MVHREVAHHTGLYLNLLGVDFPFHLVARLQLTLAHHIGLGEHVNAFLVEITVEDNGAGRLAVESALLSFFLPLVAVAIAVEADGLAGLDILAHYVDDGGSLVLACLDECINSCLEVLQRLGYSCIQHDERRCTVGLAAYGTELESVAGEGEWGSTVAVGIVDHQLRNLRNIELHTLLACQGKEFFLVGFLDMIEQVGELLA